MCIFSPKIFYALFCKQSPTTSHQEACRFVASDLTAQLCLRIVLWLEGLASEALDLEKKVKVSHDLHRMEQSSTNISPTFPCQVSSNLYLHVWSLI